MKRSKIHAANPSTIVLICSGLSAGRVLLEENPSIFHALCVFVFCVCVCLWMGVSVDKGVGFIPRYSFCVFVFLCVRC